MNIYGVSGFPTPDFTDERHCRTFSIPNTTIALAVFMGALWQLADEKNWQQYGDMTPAEAADQFLDVIWNAYADDLGICPVIPAPYWDTVTDIDDQVPEGEEEIWYGEIVALPALRSEELTFKENAFIWAVAGFIAFSGQIGAAIAFVPVAKRFVLAFKQHDLGGIVKVLIDFAEVAEIDTYGAEESIANLNIVMPDDEDEHTLYVMMADGTNPAVEGDPFIQVVRKELAATQVTPANLRWNPDTNTVQQTPDGGSTWVDNPAADPRYGAGFQLPARSSSDPQCDAAANMVVKLKSSVNIFEAEIAQVQAANALLDILLVFLPEVGIVVEALVAATEFILTIGADVISAAFTDDQWAIVLCILYCDIASDGTVNQTQFDKILDDMHTQCSTVVYDVLYTLFTLSLGVNGVSNAGATGSETGDCSSCACGWRYRWNFRTSDGGFSAIPGEHEGNYVAGNGWQLAYYGNSNGCGLVRETNIQSTPFDLAAGAKILTLALAFNTAEGCAHMEIWAGTSRSDGLSNTPSAYQSNFGTSQTYTGERDGAISGMMVGGEQQANEDGVYWEAIEIGGTGDPPNFTGGEFI